MTKQDYKLAVKNTARQIIALVEIRKSLQKVIDSLNPENFQSQESFQNFLQNETKKVQSIDTNLNRLISNVRFYHKLSLTL